MNKKAVFIVEINCSLHKIIWTFLIIKKKWKND